MNSRLIQNIMLFQVGWFACVLAGASQYSWLGVIAAIVIIVFHFAQSPVLRVEMKLVLYTTLIGLVWDSVLTATMLMRFHNGIFIHGLAPHWLIAMWSLFATTLNLSMNWLKSNCLLAALTGLAGAPAAYYAGHKLGAVDFGDTLTSLLAIGAGWAVILPVLSHMAARLESHAQFKEGTVWFQIPGSGRCP